MNILNVNIYKSLAFSAGKKTTKKEPPFPEKLEFTETELVFKDYINKRNRVERNIYTQKQNLRYYYSSQDHYDYKELLKERQNIIRSIKRLAKKYGVDSDHIELSIEEKKEYNWLAPKVFRAKTLEELNRFKTSLLHAHLFVNTQNMLLQVIEFIQKNKILK